jgi:hypothetical protein
VPPLPFLAAFPPIFAFLCTDEDVAMRPSFALSRSAVAVVAILFGASPVGADFLVPGSISPTPPVTPAVQGASVVPGGMVTDQYASLGVVFQNTAISQIGSTLAWVPVDSPNPGPPPPHQLNFASGGWGVVQGSFVMPGTSIPAVATSLRITFVGIEAEQAALVAYDPNGNMLGNPWPGTLAADGSVVLSFNAPNIAAFDIYKLLPYEQTAWGVAQIDHGPLTSPVLAPEPAAVVLAVLGGLGLLTRRKALAPDRNRQAEGRS